MIKIVQELIRQGITPVFDTRLKANRVQYLLARDQGVHVARGGVAPSSIAAKLGESLAGSTHDQQLLSERQTALLWEQAIAESHSADVLLDRRTIARWAREAAAIAYDYRVPFSRLAAEPAAEASAVGRWWQRVHEHQVANGWMDPRELLARGNDAVQSGELALDNCAWLDRTLSQPVAVALARQMYLAQASAVELALGESVVQAYPDVTEELRSAAAWAYGILANQPAGQVVVVVPGLAGRTQDVQQAFDDMAPVGAPRPYTTAGSSIGAQPSIRAALALVELLLGNRGFAVASTVLRAPSLCHGKELTTRAALERDLREQPDGQLWLLSADGLGALDSQRTGVAQHFAKTLERLSAARPRPQHRSTPMQWADDIRQWLRLAGWSAGNASLDSAWNEVLMLLASLGFNGATLTSQELVSALRREIADAHVSLPMGPLEVLASIDDVGLGCSHVWVTGMTETQYPHLPKPNPMLPLSFQRQLGIPGASALGRSRHGAGALARVRGIAQEVTFSFPQSLGDAPTSVHPLVADWPQQRITTPVGGRMLAALENGGGTEQIEDRIPPLRVGMKTGVSRALGLQARCPARAFFEYRLGAQPLELPQPGVRRQDQGRWAHQLCERLFRELPNSEIIKATDEPSRRELVSGLVDEVLRLPMSRAHGAYRAALEVEQRLLQQRLMVLLARESQRPEFAVIAREAPRQTTLGPLLVSVRLDRIDRLASGELAVVDYKTGETPQPQQWLDVPLRDIQLPLYTVLAGEAVAAALFVQIHTQVTKYQGVWPKGAFPGRPRPVADWQRLQALWRRDIERLAADLVAGLGWQGQDPKQLEDHWAPLSRIYAAPDEDLGGHVD